MSIFIQILLIVFIIWFIVSRFLPVKGIENITSHQAKEKIKNRNVQFIDVRTPGEFKANNRKPFKNYPLAQLSSQLTKLDKNKEVVIICQSGMRSMKGGKILKKQGFDKIYNVKGGMNAWV